MEILNIKGFKCFRNTDICINDMTVLVGANGYGKSSTIQALLLFKQESKQIPPFISIFELFNSKQLSEQNKNRLRDDKAFFIVEF